MLISCCTKFILVLVVCGNPIANAFPFLIQLIHFLFLLPQGHLCKKLLLNPGGIIDIIKGKLARSNRNSHSSKIQE